MRCLLFVIIFLCFWVGGMAQVARSEFGQQAHKNGRNDDWGYIGIGGGGAMFFPAISPHRADMTLVACDMGGGYITYNGGVSWRMFNLHGAVHFYVFDPMDSNTIYASAKGLFKSKDKGNTWRLIYPNPGETTGYISKGDHAGEVIATKDSTIRTVLALAVDPEDSKKLYAGISINKVTAFCVSDDEGNHWRKEWELEDSAVKIFVDPSSPRQNRTIYVAGNNSITQRIMGRWGINKGPQPGAQFVDITAGFDKKLKKYLIYGIANWNNSIQNKQSEIFSTSNGGFSWSNISSGLRSQGLQNTGLPEWRALATSNLNPATIYVSYQHLVAVNNSLLSGVAKTEDYGRTWKLVWKDVYKPGKMTAAANFSKDWLNDRFGPDWGENPLSLAVAPTNANVCYGTDLGRCIKTIDGGKSWKQVYSKYIAGAGWSSTGLEVTNAYAVVYDPYDLQHVFMANTDIGMLESKDGSKTWNSATKDNGIPTGWINTCYWITFDSVVKGKAWAVMSGVHDLPRPKMFRKNGVKNYSGGVLVTDNGGKSWSPVSNGIGEAAMTYIMYDPASDPAARILYACAFGKGVYKSVDGGRTWVQKNKGIAGEEPFAWQISRRQNDAALFLVVSRRSEDGSIDNDKDGALYRSDDGAENWTKINLPAGVNGPTSIATNPRYPHQLLLAAWGRETKGLFTPDTGGGIFISNDDGITWKPVMTDDQHISDLSFDKRVNRYYACGFERSAYYSEDGGYSWNRIPGYNFKWGKKVDFDPLDPKKIFILTFGGGVWYGPAKGDAGAQEDIIK